MLPLGPHAKTAIDPRVTFGHWAPGTPNYGGYVFNKQPITKTELNHYIVK
jgi:hypothetical protein